MDHFGSLPYLWMFSTWAGGWHKDAFSVFLVGKGWDIKANYFDFRDNGGVVYEKNGVKGLCRRLSG